MEPRVLVAGIGNIFFADDAFGVEVVRRLMRFTMPPSVRVTDFGIRSYDLAYALEDGYDVVILVDTVQKGNPPGTLYLIEPEISEMSAAPLIDGHSLNLVMTLQMVKSASVKIEHLFLVGCEPALLESEDGTLGLSEAVQESVPRAIEMIFSVIDKFVHTSASRKEAVPYA